MFDELNAAFPNHTHFYEVNLSITEAMERCARMAAGDVHVVNYQGKVIFAAQHAMTGISNADWISEVPGAPVEVVAEEPVVEEVVEETPAPAPVSSKNK